MQLSTGKLWGIRRMADAAGLPWFAHGASGATFQPADASFRHAYPDFGGAS